MIPNIGFISLGCAKATSDTERLLTRIRSTGYNLTGSYENADLVIVNTCGFIDDAIAESLDVIGEAVSKVDKVLVIGCLGKKQDLIKSHHPEVLSITGPDEDDAVIECIRDNLPMDNPEFIDLVPPEGIRLTPKHYAWLKISEGCNQKCSFCIIPSMRGRLNSRSMSQILTEAENLRIAGVKELLIISQDTAAYGVDKKYRKELISSSMISTDIINLAKKLGEMGIWVRMHYVYPYPKVDQLVELMADGIILPYLDVPLQHSSPKILKLMRRPANIESMVQRIEKWRNICPDIALRTTLIAGFPGETTDDFDMLYDFVNEIKFNRVGVFTYSAVDGASANELPGQVEEEVKIFRQNILLDTQAEISKELLAKRVGSIETIMVDELCEGGIIGRSKYDAPEVDGVVHIHTDNEWLDLGDLTKVEIIGSDEHDLEARLLE